MGRPLFWWTTINMNVYYLYPFIPIINKVINCKTKIITEIYLYYKNILGMLNNLQINNMY